VAARHIRTRCEEVWIRSGGSGGRRRGVAGVGEERGGDGDKAAIIEGFVRFFFLVFYIFLLFLLFCRPNGYTAGPSWAVNQITI
jgi:hypothetical protein